MIAGMLMEFRAGAMRALILGGIASSVLYVFIDLIGASNYPYYDYGAQAISEMSAIGAPTARLLAPLYQAWSGLFVAFAVGALLASVLDPRFAGRPPSCLRCPWSDRVLPLSR